MAHPLNDILLADLTAAMEAMPAGQGPWIALSGGLDSSLLLMLAAQAAACCQRPLNAIHVNHGLQQAAACFEHHCTALCTRLDVPLTRVAVHVDPAGKGEEAAARKARYQAFAEKLPAGSELWLAHHQDDQAETLLLAALRGSGIRGLAGMPERRRWKGLEVVRPWRSRSRTQLRQAALALALDWCEDPTNADDKADRNFLRHHIMPRLDARWTRAAHRLAQAASQAGDADGLLFDYASEELAQLTNPDRSLPVAALVQRNRARQRLLVRTACQQQGLATPPRQRLETLLDQLGARPDASVHVAWPGGEGRVWRAALYLVPNSTQAGVDMAGWRCAWRGVPPLETPIGNVWIEVATQGGLLAGFRQGGERMVLERRGRRDLKRLLQEAGLAPWQRDQVLVIKAEHRAEQQDCVAAVHLPSGMLWKASGWAIQLTPAGDRYDPGPRTRS